MDPVRRGRKEGKEGRQEGSKRKEGRKAAGKEGKNEARKKRSWTLKELLHFLLHFLLHCGWIFFGSHIYIFLFLIIIFSIHITYTYIYIYIPSHTDLNKSNGRRFPHCPAGTLRSPFVELLKLGDRLDHCLPQVASKHTLEDTTAGSPTSVTHEKKG